MASTGASRIECVATGLPVGPYFNKALRTRLARRRQDHHQNLVVEVLRCAHRYYAANLARAAQLARVSMRGLPSADPLREAITQVSGNIRVLAGMTEDADRLSMESSAAWAERLWRPYRIRAIRLIPSS